MAKLRYMLVTHPLEESTPTLSEANVWQGKLPAHDLVGRYHWARMDDGTVVVLATYNVSNHTAIFNHPNITVLPSIYSNTTIERHIDNYSKMSTQSNRLKANFAGAPVTERSNHKNSLRSFMGKVSDNENRLMAARMKAFDEEPVAEDENLDYSETYMPDFVDMVQTHFGPLFSPEQ